MNILTFSKTYSALRKVALVSLFMLILSNILWAYLFVSDRYGLSERVYVIQGDGKVNEAKLSENTQRSREEIESHLASFCSLMFGHDAKSYDGNINKALHLISKEEGLAIFRDFEKNEIYDLYLQYGSRSRFDLDTILLGADQKSGRVFGHQVSLFEGEEKPMSMGASFKVNTWTRSRENPHGILIYDWRFIPYEIHK